MLGNTQVEVLDNGDGTSTCNLGELTWQVGPCTGCPRTHQRYYGPQLCYWCVFPTRSLLACTGCGEQSEDPDELDQHEWMCLG